MFYYRTLWQSHYYDSEVFISNRSMDDNSFSQVIFTFMLLFVGRGGGLNFGLFGVYFDGGLFPFAAVQSCPWCVFVCSHLVHTIFKNATLIFLCVSACISLLAPP